MNYLPDPPSEIIVDPSLLRSQQCDHCLEDAAWFFETGKVCNTHLFGV